MSRRRQPRGVQPVGLLAVQRDAAGTNFSQPAPPDAPLELYNLIEDSGETTDIARHPDVVERLTAGYDRWLADVSDSRGYHPVRFTIGSDLQPHVTLTRQDWRMPRRCDWSPAPESSRPA